jgi:hypothetical protein
MTRSKGMVNSFGPMEDHTKETGTMENNMEKVCMSHRKEQRSLESGEKERG